MIGAIPLRLPAAVLLPALAACAHAQPGLADTHPPSTAHQPRIAHQPGIAVTHSPPPRIVAVPSSPEPQVRILQPAPLPSLPAPPAARIVRAPQERRPAQAYVHADDYPASALANREQGRVAVTLAVGPDGRAFGCTVTRSSGSRALDSATCAILRRRARFTPAIDSHGNPAAGLIRQQVEWRLPK